LFAAPLICRSQKDYIRGFIAGVVLFAFIPTLAEGAPFDCKQNRCGILSKGNYDNLVIGKVERVADDKDMRKLYRWARTHGYWKSLAPDEMTYLHSVKILSLSVTTPDRRARRSITALMTPKEFAAGELRAGDQVRYSPHDPEHIRKDRPADPKARAYWDLVGCIQLVCGARDKSCRQRYRSGVYRREDGREVDPGTGRILAHGARLDPVSLLPAADARTPPLAKGRGQN
jgi:hypothetical protein